MTKITRKQIKLSKDVLAKKKLYNGSKTNVIKAIEKVIFDVQDRNIEEFGICAAPVWEIVDELRKQGYSIK